MEKEDPKSREELVEENRFKEMYIHDTKEFDFRGKCPTDVKNCPEIHLPKSRSAKEEVEVGAKHAVVMQETVDYIREL